MAALFITAEAECGKVFVRRFGVDANFLLLNRPKGRLYIPYYRAFLAVERRPGLWAWLMCAYRGIVRAPPIVSSTWASW